MLSKNTTNNKKSSIIPIPKNKTNFDVDFETNKNQYSLKNNLFDPTKSSPPNIFMLKLYSRILQYDNQPLQK